MTRFSRRWCILMSLGDGPVLPSFAMLKGSMFVIYPDSRIRFETPFDVTYALIVI